MGPYVIMKLVTSVAYKLKLQNELAKIHSVVHVSILKRSIGNTV